jgi:hypothetical protein
MIADVIRRLAVRDLPDDVAFVQIDRCDASRKAASPAANLEPSGLPSFAAAAPAAATAGAFGSVARPEMKRMSPLAGLRPNQTKRRDLGRRIDVEHLGFRIEGAARPICAAGGGWKHQRSRAVPATC